ncbi:MAG: dTDP-4-amino-4,6-dideoxygalactose transaminase [Oligoflexia bacterium]|nr:dTDP-4-amino-4,6-dideoxygalactose transaminase [Oligoflexia bacterium]
MTIPFNKMSVVGNEEKYLLEALHSGKWCGRGPKTIALENLLKEICKVKYVFFVTSCTSALEISCLISNIGPGDEVIMPSFGFVSAANAVVLRGAKPIFADVELDSWNLSARTVAPLLTTKTKAILTVHYAGSSAGIEDLRELCKQNKLFLIEDAAQSLGAKRSGKFIGPTPWTTCFSLHETKNISSGEGGLLMTDSEEIASKVEIQIEKGTNRQKFFRGEIDKYTWVDRGSSYIASDLLAAVALGQVEKLKEITSKRKSFYERYKNGLAEFEGKITWQKTTSDVETNGHVAAFTVDPQVRAKLISQLKEKGIGVTFHYVPLHDAPFAKENGFSPTKDLPNTRLISEGLIRLPIYYSMTEHDVEHVLQTVRSVINKI